MRSKIKSVSFTESVRRIFSFSVLYNPLNKTFQTNRRFQHPCNNELIFLLQPSPLLVVPYLFRLLTQKSCSEPKPNVRFSRLFENKHSAG